MTLGTRLKAARTAKGHGLREVAKLTGVSASTISRAERGYKTISADYLIKLAECYGVSVVDLLDDGHTMTNEQVDAFLIGHGYNLEELRAEINALIDELKAETAALMAERKRPP